MEFYVEFDDNDFLILMKVGKSTCNCEKFSCITDKGGSLSHEQIEQLVRASPMVFAIITLPLL